MRDLLLNVQLNVCLSSTCASTHKSADPAYKSKPEGLLMIWKVFWQVCGSQTNFSGYIWLMRRYSTDISGKIETATLREYFSLAFHRGNVLLLHPDVSRRKACLCTVQVSLNETTQFASLRRLNLELSTHGTGSLSLTRPKHPKPIKLARCFF